MGCVVCVFVLVSKVQSVGSLLWTEECSFEFSILNITLTLSGAQQSLRHIKERKKKKKMTVLSLGCCVPSLPEIMQAWWPDSTLNAFIVSHLQY